MTGFAPPPVPESLEEMYEQIPEHLHPVADELRAIAENALPNSYEDLQVDEYRRELFVFRETERSGVLIGFYISYMTLYFLRGYQLDPKIDPKGRLLGRHKVRRILIRNLDQIDAPYFTKIIRAHQKLGPLYGDGTEDLKEPYNPHGFGRKKKKKAKKKAKARSAGKGKKAKKRRRAGG